MENFIFIHMIKDVFQKRDVVPVRDKIRRSTWKLALMRMKSEPLKREFIKLPWSYNLPGGYQQFLEFATSGSFDTDDTKDVIED